MNRSPIAGTVERHRLVDVARRTGIAVNSTTGAVTVRCPLPSHSHPDRTPSMRLYLDDDRYYCFGCGAKGDVIQWVRDAERVNVSEAIRLLDSASPISHAWASVPHVPRNDLRGHPGSQSACAGEARGQAEAPDLDRTPPYRIHAALKTAWSYYSYRSLHTRGATYLKERGLDVAVLEAHTGRTEVGHTPTKPDGLVAALRASGFSEDELVDAGLACRSLCGDRFSDFYRQRVVIPLRDNRGEICGFVGRNVGDPRWPKYKNPPRTATYDKSVNLYRPLQVPQRRDGRVVVVEGTLDAMAIAIASIEAGVADYFCPVTQSGRELSGRQLAMVLHIHRAAPVVAMDGDAAGRESTVRVASAIASAGRRVLVTRLPDGEDPASWLTSVGPSGLAIFVGGASQFVADRQDLMCGSRAIEVEPR